MQAAVRRLRWWFVAAAMLVGPAFALGAAVHRPTAGALQQRARDIGAQAYIYGLALLDEQRVIARFPTNTLVSLTQLADPTERLIPAPNVDTLYTVARLELASGPLVLHVPDTHGRYYVFELLDPYTNISIRRPHEAWRRASRSHTRKSTATAPSSRRAASARTTAGWWRRGTSATTAATTCCARTSRSTRWAPTSPLRRSIRSHSSTARSPRFERRLRWPRAVYRR